MHRKKLSVQSVVAIGIGTAILFLLKRYVSIPSGIPNTNIDTSYGFLGFISIMFGPIVGLFVGFFGHSLSDFTQFGAPWWTWVFTTGFIGFAIGLLKKYIVLADGKIGFKKLVIYNIYQILINIIGWSLLAPTGDVLIYSEPSNKVYLQGIISSITNSISTGVIGTILLVMYASTKVEKGSLKKE
ncbi:ECF-type riboflavin transporter substrate-binding protein [Apilactobacillus micheneri]|uniref:UPF0397 protein DY114_00880 n=1 Tax=Apilactobacillus micheneri TaxID=1899430 RepID=A0A9Q8ILH6_9LACO|nr:ECF-type riboflavin transporter substrate-binding protein [Apilactobacillus micheneri]TPR26281.1 ECF-type riboflavin transporter substrate-binding protein [Apilactobacillus micheneri]TPR27035.1 ECF-type riboflavin transporter substrate-binding protein [Apilactobacillus micheneri]TPR27893.1 ECF-type riboflavin transporter substrate-binding protein [Apilactobacillus micheneri]TPR31798.1 ECF-type riboflavin transporter substrate-binding protein [Apilactobacillus micheneri]TPR32202.1 ECF-type r